MLVANRSNRAAEGRTPGTSGEARRRDWGSFRRMAAGSVALLLGATAACYPPAQARRDLVPSWQPAVGQHHSAVSEARLRHGSFTLDGFRGSQATRRWPLLDSRTVSRRYEYSVNESGVAVLDAACRLIRVLGDAARDRSDLACSLLPKGAGGSWRLDLSGEGWRSGVLSGPEGGGRYAVTPDPESAPNRGGRNPATVYLIRDGEVVVATVTLRGRGSIWLSPILRGDERAAVMATVFALLLEHEVKVR